MATFEITMTDKSVQRVDAAEAYEQEGPMTTFFVSEGNRGRLDSWATRLASFRSADVFMIRRCDVAAERPQFDLVLAAAE